MSSNVSGGSQGSRLDPNMVTAMRAEADLQREIAELATAIPTVTSMPTNAVAAWQRGKVTALIGSEGFDSTVFTVIAGAEKQRFTAHAAYLSQSPVLECMCYGRFKESQESRIELPDDDPVVIKAIIQYLYSGDSLDFGTMESGGGSAGAADQLSDIYITAEKYQLLDLKALIVEKLRTVTDVEERPVEFLNTAQKIYADIPEEKPDAYRDFFKEMATEIPRPKILGKPVHQAWLETLSYGGILAIDLATSMAKMYDECIHELIEAHSEEKKLLVQLETTKMNLRWENEDLRKLLDRAKENKWGLTHAAESLKEACQVHKGKIKELVKCLEMEKEKNVVVMSRHNAIHQDCKLCGLLVELSEG